METYLYFRKFRPVTHVHTVSSGDVSNWANAGAGSATTFIEPTAATTLGTDDIDSMTEVASVVVKSAGSNSNVGTNYSGGATVAEEEVTLNLANVAVTNSRFVIDEASGTGTTTKDTADGYTFIANDEITITFQQGLETSFMYPASGLVGIEATATGQTTLKFKSLKNDGTIDPIIIEHDNGKYEDIVNGINAVINGDNYGGITTIIDGSGGSLVLAKELGGLGIDGLKYTPESGY